MSLTRRTAHDLYRTPQRQLSELESLGFDQSTATRTAVIAACSQCAAVVIQGIPCHETGCQNARHECHGCDTLVPTNVRYCDDCR